MTALLNAVTKIQADLPQFQKTAADLKQAVADKADPTKLSADINSLLSDIQTDLADLAAIIPASIATSQPPTA